MLLEVETVHELEGAWWAFALKAARRASVSALCCAMRRRFSSGVTLVSPRGCRVNGLPISNGGWVTRLCQPARSCGCAAHTIKPKLTVRMNAEAPGTGREYRQVGRRP